MIKLQCPVCGRTAEADGAGAWPQFPFCSPKCKTIDLGRWLGESYRIPAEEDAEDSPDDVP
jgi:endogenous inhibitor of DNA gyrase (YacG/DUF329 family)